jgi:hypothetical protein
MHRLPWQTTGKYAAEIQYYTIPKCRELLEELLRQYNFFTFEADEDWTKKQRNEYNQQANTAFDTLGFLFRDQVEFCSQESAEHELDESYAIDGTKDLIKKKNGWLVRNLLRGFHKNRGWRRLHSLRGQDYGRAETAARPAHST